MSFLQAFVTNLLNKIVIGLGGIGLILQQGPAVPSTVPALQVWNSSKQDMASIDLGGNLSASGSANFRGSLSGSALYGAGLGTCNGTTDKLIYNRSTGLFSCGTDQSGGNFGSGNVITTGDKRYVQKQGGTMTGALSILVSGGTNNTVGLEVTSTVSGRTLHAQDALESSGTLVVKNTGLVQGNLTTRGVLSGSSLVGSNLVSCPNVKSSANGALSCNNTAYLTSVVAGQGLSVAGGNVLSLNAVITGSSLKIRGNLSGSTLRVNGNTDVWGNIAASGSLKARGALSGASLTVNNLISCANLMTTSAGALSCNSSSYQTTSLTDDNTWVGSAGGIATATSLPSCSNGTSNALEYNTGTNAFSCATISGTTYTAGQGLSVTNNVFTLNTTNSGTLSRYATQSGNLVFANTALVSSGTLITESGVYINGTALVVQGASHNVGIGTGSPSTELQIVSANTHTELLLDNTAVDGDPRVNFRLPGVSQWLEGLDDSDSDKFKIDDGSSLGASTRLTIDHSGLVGIGLSSPKTRLEVAGTTSGSALTVSNLRSCDTIDTDANGNLSCGTDANTTYQAAQGLTLNGTAFRLSNAISGTSLKIQGTMSGYSLAVSSLQSCTNLQSDSHGALSCNNTSYLSSITAGQGLTVAGSVVSLNATNSGTLSRYTTQSGALVFAKNTLASSGTLVWEGAASGASLVVSSQFSGAGLADCSDGTNSKLLWSSATKRFSCGADQNTGGGGGMSQAQADARYVNTAGDTMTGGLLLVNGGHGGQTIDAGLMLEIAGTASGRTLHAQNQLTSSGTLMVTGTSTLATTFQVYSLVDGSLNVVTKKPPNNNQKGLDIDVEVSAGSGSGDGGGVGLFAGAGGTDFLNGGGEGGPIDLNSGDGGGAGGNGGRARMKAGSAGSGSDADGGQIVLLTGAGDGTGNGGDFNINGGNGGINAGKGGGFFILGGYGGDNGGKGGDFALAAGDGGGICSNCGNTGNGGEADIDGGGGKGSTYAGGDVVILGGQGIQGAVGGNVILAGGVTGVNGNSTTSGSIIFESPNQLVQAKFDLYSLTGNQTFTFPNKSGTFAMTSDIVGGSSSFGSGNVLTLGDRRYLKKQGGTLSGAMAIYVGATQAIIPDAGLALEVIGTASGRVLHAQDKLESSGSLIVRTTGLVQGNLTTRGVLSGSSLVGSNLVSCTNLQTASNGALSCNNTVYLTSQTVSAVGQGLSLVGGLLTLSTTNSGSLSRYLTQSGGTVFARTIIQDSGSLVVHSTSTLQGALTVRAAMSGASLAVSNLVSCTNLQTSAAGALSCNSASYQTTALADDSTWIGSSGNVATATAIPNCAAGTFLAYATSTNTLTCSSDNYVAGQGLTLSSKVFSLSASFSGSSLEIAGTSSGRIVHAQDTLNSSGTLVLKKLAGTSTGNILIVDSKGLVYDASNKRVGIGLTAPKVSFEVVGAMSGSSLTISGLSSCAFLQSSSAGALSCGTTLALSAGGTNKNMTPVNGGVVYTDSDSMEVSAAGSSGMTLVSQGAAAPVYKREHHYERFTLFGPQVNAVAGSGVTFPTAFSGAITAANLQASGYGSGVTVQVFIGNNRVFSTPLSTDNKEANSTTAATPAVINGTNARFNKLTNMRIDVPAVGTPTTSTGVVLTLWYDVTSW